MNSLQLRPCCRYAVATCALVAFCQMAFYVASASAQTTINFDEDPAGTPIVAPIVFVDSVNLTTLYASQGVVFSGGVGPLDGGSILDQNGNFGVNARSGRNFLAFNEENATNSVSGSPIDPEVLTFNELTTDVEIYASGGGASASFRMEAFLSNGLVATETQASPAGDYVRLAISLASGFDTVVLTETSGKLAYVYDDLTFQSVPEPSTLLLVIGAMGAWAIRRHPWKREMI